MKTVKLVAILAVAMALAAVVLQNTSPVLVRFFWLSGEMPAILLLFLTSAAGFMLGLGVAIVVRSGTKSTSSKKGD